MGNDQSVVVTGSSTGIGEACTHYLTDRGFQVFATVRTQSDADRLVAQAPSGLIPLLLDVTKHETIVEAAKTVSRAVGNRGLAGLVNNAGVVVGGPLELIPIDRLRMQLEVNLIGQVAVTQVFVPLLRQARGRIVNMSSISGRIASPMIGPYAISKFALEAFSDSLRRELSPWGIAVSVVEPGAISTPIWAKSIDRVDYVLEALPAEARELYGASIEEARSTAEKISETAIPATAVAEAVHHALTAARPRTRYVIGRDARLFATLAWLLPDRTMDWIMRRGRGQTRRAESE